MFNLWLFMLPRCKPFLCLKPNSKFSAESTSHKAHKNGSFFNMENKKKKLKLYTSVQWDAEQSQGKRDVGMTLKVP